MLTTAATAASTGITAADNNKPMTTTNQTPETRHDATVTIHTTAGDIKVRLYGDTPRHRDNFLKLAREGFYDGVLFHRVIRDFMVQTGDPLSKNAPKGKMLGTGDPGYEIDAEIVYPAHFHKRGALAAARTGDAVNPQKRSSGSQFYIVTGARISEGKIGEIERRRRMSIAQAEFDRMAREQRDSIMAMRRSRDTAGLQALQDRLADEAERLAREADVALTDEQRQAYIEQGGTPHLDGEYTVFGEVVEGMETVERIQQAATDRNDRPEEDIRITGITIDND